MKTYTAHVTARDGTTRRLDLRAHDLPAAHAAVRQVAIRDFGRGFTYSVRPA